MPRRPAVVPAAAAAVAAGAHHAGRADPAADRLCGGLEEFRRGDWGIGGTGLTTEDARASEPMRPGRRRGTTAGSRAGIAGRLLEQFGGIGQAWRTRYNRVQLNSSRATSRRAARPAARDRLFCTRDEIVRHPIAAIGNHRRSEDIEPSQQGER